MLQLKTAWRDGTARIVTSPLEFMQHLAALVPRTPEDAAGESEVLATEPGCVHGLQARRDFQQAA